MLAPLSVSSAFLVSPLFAFVTFLLYSVLWSAAFLTQDVALGRFGLAVTLGVALAAIFSILFCDVFFFCTWVLSSFLLFQFFLMPTGTPLFVGPGLP